MIDVTSEDYEGPREHGLVVQDMDDYVMNGPQRPEGEGWVLFDSKNCHSAMALIWLRPLVTQ